MTHQDIPRADDQIDISAFIGVLRRQYRVIVMSVASIIVLAVIYLFAVTPKYTATALVSIEPNRGVLSEDVSSQNNSAAISAQVEGEVAILKSSDVLLALIAEANLVSDPEFGVTVSRSARIMAWLGIETDTTTEAGAAVTDILRRVGDAVAVRRRGLTYLVEVSVTSQDPERAAELANLLVSIYTTRQVENKIRQILASRDILAPRIDNAQAELERLQTEADRFLEDVVADFVENSDREDLIGVRDRFSLAQGQLDGLRQQSAALRAIVEGRGVLADQSDLLSAAVLELAAQREALQRQLETDPSASGIDADALRAELANVDNRLREMAARDRDASLAGISDLTQVAERARAELREAALASDLPSADLSMFYRLQQESATARIDYENLLRRLRQLETLADVQISDAVMASSAVMPSNPSFPNSRLILALAIVAALGVGVGLAFINEFLIGGVTSEDQLRELLNAPVALPVPAISTPEDGDVTSQIWQAPMSGFSESLRQVRRLAARLTRPGEGGRIYLFTSAVPEEGKTTTAIAFARTLALSGTKTLLVDFDLRKPSIAHRIGAPASTALLDALSGGATDADLAGCHFHEAETGLDILVGGGRSDLPTDTLVSSTRTVQFLHKLRKEFDAIVIDTAPVLPVVDTLYLTPYADLVVMMVRYAATNQRDVKRAAERIRGDMHDGVHVLPVLSMEQRGKKAYYYGGYYSGYQSRSSGS
jgi:uncharacterized protein involved in exopolysaccharide biosynthesis